MAMYKVFQADHTEYDLYFIAVKNTLKEFFITANTIPYLPEGQQKSARAIVNNIDTFINNRLLDTVKRFAEMDMAENKIIYDVIEQRQEDTAHRFHKALRVKYFVLMDYFLFKFTEEHCSQLYTDISIMDTVPPEEVFGRLQFLSEEFKRLEKCKGLNDLGKEALFYGVYDALLASVSSEISVLSYDPSKGLAEMSITPKNEMQAKAIMGFFEKNWEQSADGYQNNVCFFKSHSGIPLLNIILYKTEFGYEPCTLAIRPSREYTPYFGVVSSKSQIPKEFLDMVEAVLNWYEQNIGR